MNMRFVPGLLILSFALVNANAATIIHVDVTKRGKHYVTEAEFVIDAPRNAVTQAFANFDQLADLNPAIVASQSRLAADGKLQVTTELRDCIALFCKTVTLIENVRIDEDGNFQSQVEPVDSDFKSGNASWTFVARDEQTWVSYRSRMRPNFWVPPLLGRRAMQKAVKRQIEASINNLEAPKQSPLYGETE